jgi:hypothetical protein
MKQQAETKEKDLWLYFKCGCSLHWEPLMTCYCQPLHWQIPQPIYGWVFDECCNVHRAVQFGSEISKVKQLEEQS